MRSLFKLIGAVVIAVCSLPLLCAQDLSPRAYIITPVHANAIILTNAFYDGGISFNGTLPITNATAKLYVPTLSYYHALSLFRRSANINVSLPYGVGVLEGNVIGEKHRIYRSGLQDIILRFSVNLKGGPAMSAKEFRSWRQKTIIGVSLKVVAPAGQYDSARLINYGSNRWAFKPEIGFSRRWGPWVLDTYGAVWFFTTNPDYFSHNAFSPGTNTQSQASIGALEGHLSYGGRNPRLWASLDGNYWYGGRTSLNGIESPGTLQASSRIGGTCSVPLTPHQSLKFSYNYGDYIRFGGNYHNLSVAWQYSWLGRP